MNAISPAALILVVAVIAVAITLTFGTGSGNDATGSPTPAPTALRGSDHTTESTHAPQSSEFYESNIDQLMNFLADPEFHDREFYMFNFVGYRDQAVYKDGRETNLTGFEANQIYAEFVLPQLQQIGAEIMFQASIQWDMNEDTPFTDATIVRYPNSTVFQQMTSSPEFAEFVVHKEAGLGVNFVMACERLDLFYIPPLENPPFPANETNLETTMININDYREKAIYQEGDADADNNRTGREAADLYSTNAGPIVAEYGVRTLGEFNVKAVVVGDIGYEHIRMNWFPSDENWNQVISDPERKAFSHHRQAGIEEQSKSFKVMPISLNKFFPSDSGGAGDDTTCNICGDNGVLTNPSGEIDIPGGESLVCSQIELAASAGQLSSDQCTTLSSFASGPCGCTNAGSTVPDSETSSSCALCDEGSISNLDATVQLPDGQAATCGQLDLAAQNGLLPYDACSVISDAVRITCGCA